MDGSDGNVLGQNYYHVVKESARIDAELTPCIKTDRSNAKSKGGIRFDDSVHGDSSNIKSSFKDAHLRGAVSMESIFLKKPATETPPNVYPRQNSRGSHGQSMS